MEKIIDVGNNEIQIEFTMIEHSTKFYFVLLYFGIACTYKSWKVVKLQWQRTLKFLVSPRTVLKFFARDTPNIYNIQKKIKQI